MWEKGNKKNMEFDPNLILYACVARDTMVLAEFNSKDHPDLGLLALKCLAKTPSFHTYFSHTIRGRTYTFLIQEPFTYFTISEEKLEHHDVLSFLDSVKFAFGDVGDNMSKRKLDTLGSHCFQGEFNPVFHQLLSVSSDMQGPDSRRMGMKLGNERSTSMESSRGGRRIGKVPLLAEHGGLKKKRKKRQFLNELFLAGKSKGGGERKVDVCNDGSNDVDDDDDDDVDSRLDFSGNRNRGVSRDQSGVSDLVDPGMLRDAKKSWRKHVWIVLSLDLIICLVLFSVWLWVCRGFKCIDD